MAKAMMPLLVIGPLNTKIDNHINRLKTSGFTLIEFLIVITILSIVLSFAMMATGNFGQSNRVQSTADEFKHLLPLAIEYAVLTPANLGLAINPDGYEFFQYIPDTPDQAAGHWQSLSNDKLFHRRKFTKNIRMKLIHSGTGELPESNAVTPAAHTVTPEAYTVIPAKAGIQAKNVQILIATSGDVTPFEVDIYSEKSQQHFYVSTSNNGTIELASQSTRPIDVAISRSADVDSGLRRNDKIKSRGDRGLSLRAKRSNLIPHHEIAAVTSFPRNDRNW